jgi:hypothetical protein
MTARQDSLQDVRAREIRPTDIAGILDHLEDLAATSNAAARTAALDIRDIYQVSASDMSRFYAYVNLLGSPTLTESQFLRRRMRDRDFLSRRHIEYLYELVDNAFGGAYAAACRRDMAVTGGSFFEMQDGVGSPLTDSVGSIVDLTAAAPPPEVSGPLVGTVARGASPWADLYNSATLDPQTDAGESGTVEMWLFQTALGGATGGQNFYRDVGTGTLRLIDFFDELVMFASGTTLADPGTWITLTAYAQGDRRRPTSDDGNVYECEVAGTTAGPEPTWPIDQLTVVDGTVTWRHVCARTVFHNYHTSNNVSTGQIKGPSVAVAVNTWHHVVMVKDGTGLHLYANGVLASEVLPPDADTVPGSFGTPVRNAIASQTFSGAAVDIGAEAGVSGPVNGSIAFLAVYDAALTAAQILDHYNSGVDQGIN